MGLLCEMLSVVEILGCALDNNPQICVAGVPFRTPFCSDGRCMYVKENVMSSHHVSSVARARTAVILAERFSAHALQTDFGMRLINGVVALSYARWDSHAPAGNLYGMQYGLRLVTKEKSSETYCVKFQTDS